MTEIAARTDVLAEWSYTPEEWARYSAYEGRHFIRLIRQTRTAFFAFAAVVVLGFVIVVIVWSMGQASVTGMLTAAGLILVFGGGFAGLCAIVWRVQKLKLDSLTTGRGTVVITPTGVNTNGVWHNWRYDNVVGTRFHDASIMTIAANTPDEMELLEIRMIAWVSWKPSGDVIGSCRVPIPAGQRKAADDVVRELTSRKDRG